MANIRICLVLLLLLSSVISSAQLFVTLEPTFFRPGLLYNQQFNKIGVYSHAWWGDIKGQHEDGGIFYTENAKLGLGISIKTRGMCPYIGVNRNWFYNTNTDDRIIQLDKIHKYSFEVGFSLNVKERLTSIMITDILNWESIIGFSYQFKNKRRR